MLLAEAQVKSQEAGSELISPIPLLRYVSTLVFACSARPGVAIGLSILASEQLGGPFGEAVMLVITSTTFLVQIIGPPLVKVGVKKAGEVGLNVTEQDLNQSYRIADVMDKKVPVISAGLSLRELITLFGYTDNFYYPVINNANELIGAITLGGIKKTFATQELND